MAKFPKSSQAMVSSKYVSEILFVSRIQVHAEIKGIDPREFLQQPTDEEVIHLLYSRK